MLDRMASSSILTSSVGRNGHWDTIPANFKRSRTFTRRRSSLCKERLIVRPPIATSLHSRCSLPTSKKHCTQRRRMKHDYPGSPQTTHSEDNHVSCLPSPKLCSARSAVPTHAVSHSRCVTPPWESYGLWSRP